MREGMCGRLTWAIGTGPIRDGTLNLSRQAGVAPAKKWGRSLLAEQVRSRGRIR